MTTDNTTIGIRYDDGNAITVEELRKDTISSYFTINQYCDFRYSTNIGRFNYDPYTGEKIDWKEVKRLLKLNVK